MTVIAEPAFGLPEHAISRLRGVFQRWPAVRRVLIYGSRAKGNHRRASDIDRCLEGAQLTVADLLAIDAAIDDLLLPWRVDLVLRAGIEDPALADHIARMGRVLYEQGDSGDGDASDEPS